MNTNERFDQLESLLVDLARKVDRHGEQLAQILAILEQQGAAISQLGDAASRQGAATAQLSDIVFQQGAAITQQGAAIAQQSAAISQQGKLLTIVSEQADGIIEFLKLSAARHEEAERRQDAMLAEIQRQGQRQDAGVEALRALLKRQDATDLRLDSTVQTQLQMLQLMRADADKIDSQEPRIKRLEDEVFRAAS